MVPYSRMALKHDVKEIILFSFGTGVKDARGVIYQEPVVTGPAAFHFPPIPKTNQMSLLKIRIPKFHLVFLHTLQSPTPVIYSKIKQCS